MNLFLYIKDDANDAGYDTFWKNDALPTAQFCIFTSFRLAVLHLFRQHMTELQEVLKSTDKNVENFRAFLAHNREYLQVPEQLTDDALDIFHRYFVLWYGEELIFGLPTDRFGTKQELSR